MNHMGWPFHWDGPLSQSQSSHAQRGCPIDGDMSQGIRGPVSINILLPCCCPCHPALASATSYYCHYATPCHHHCPHPCYPHHCYPTPCHYCLLPLPPSAEFFLYLAYLLLIS